MKTINRKEGFTLIEILVVIGIIAILAAVVLVAINPARQFAQANNSQRTSNINTILNAIGQRMVDGKGKFDGTFTAGGTSYACPTLPTTETPISNTGFDLAACAVPTYVAASIPIDPKGSTTCTPAWTSVTNYNTCYTAIFDTATGRVTIKAPAAELGETIEVAR